MFQSTLKAGLAHVLVAALGLTTVQVQSSSVRNVVLVHGAWADRSRWKGVYDRL
jgi:hypothetical protein